MRRNRRISSLHSSANECPNLPELIHFGPARREIAIRENPVTTASNPTTAAKPGNAARLSGIRPNHAIDKHMTPDARRTYAAHSLISGDLWTQSRPLWRCVAKPRAGFQAQQLSYFAFRRDMSTRMPVLLSGVQSDRKLRPSLPTQVDPQKLL